MRIADLGIRQKKAIVILGAGASRGAACFENNLLPAPVDDDFFSLMERVQHVDSRLQQLLAFVKGEFGETAFPKMEEFFTQLEALAEFHEELKIKRGRRIDRYRKQLQDFVGNVACFFRQIFVDSTGQGSKAFTCAYHDRLAETLHSEDAIVSFNYDCLIDEALRRKAARSWNPRGGYGVELSKTATAGWEPVAIGSGRKSSKPVVLLKLHGSLNWDRTGGSDLASLKLRAEPYASASRAATEVVPPVWDKTIGADPVLRDLWKHARRILPTGPVLVVVGYSAPATDLLSQALIRVAASERAQNQKLTHLIVVNPDSSARRRVITLVKGGMDVATAIIELQSMKELSQLLVDG